MPPQNPGTDDADISWSSDIAARMAPAGDSRKVDQFQPIAPYHNLHFLDSSIVSEQIISAGRGMGKSTLLMYRMRHLKSAFQLVRSVPPFGFRLVASGIPVPHKAFWHFRAIEPWAATWKLVLGALFACAIKRAIDSTLTATRRPEEWLQAFSADPEDTLYCELVRQLQTWTQSPHDECVADMILTVLRHRPPSDRLTGLYRQKIKPIISARNISGKNTTGWLLYVDGIDEAIANFDEKSLLLRGAAASYIDNEQVTEQNAHIIGQQVWKCSQAGFAHAAFQLREETTAQLVAYGSIRSETYQQFMNQSLTDAKLQHFVLHISYPPEMLRRVFNYNVSLMPARSRLQVPKSVELDENQQAAHAFCGYTLIFSRDVFAHVEDCYSLVRRHCFGTPRGLMVLGRAIRDIQPGERWDGVEGQWRDPEAVIAAVVKQSRAVLSEHLKTLFPPWDNTFEMGFPLLKHDVLTAEQAQTIEKEFAGMLGAEQAGFFSYLFACGLIGVPGGKSSGKGKIQQFLTANEADVTFPSSFNYLLVHPALAAHLRSQLKPDEQDAFFNRRIVVNPGATCPPFLLPPRIRIDCTAPNLAVYLPAHRDELELKLFKEADRVGRIFLAVLAVASRYHMQRFEQAGYVGVEELIFAAERLSRLGLLIAEIGRPKKSLRDFFTHLCKSESHVDITSPGTAVDDARALLKESDRLDVLVRFESTGNQFALACRDGGREKDRTLEWVEIDVTGMSTADFLLGAAPQAHHKRTLSESDWGA